MYYFKKILCKIKETNLKRFQIIAPKIFYIIKIGENYHKVYKKRFLIKK